jgi:hypothetical protein
MAAIFSLSLGLIFSSCSKKEAAVPLNKVSLQAAIDSATLLYNTTGEGTKPGYYVVGSRTALKAILDAANSVLTSAASTQADLTNAAAQLQAAINAYKAAFIEEIAAVNLIGFWKFNGNANDSTGNGNNGTVTAGHAFFGAGTPSLTADRFARAGMAYHFDHGGNIEIPYTAALNPTQMSISLWVRQDTIGRSINPNNCYMVSMNRWNGYKFQTQPSLPFYTVKVDTLLGQPQAIWDRDDAGTAINPGANWYHLVVTFKADEMKFYVNGVLATTWPTPQGAGKVPGTAISLSATPINLTLGSDLPTSKYLTVDASGNFLVDYGGFWTGDMDDVMFYNIALTGPQVTSIYTNQNTL